MARNTVMHLYQNKLVSLSIFLFLLRLLKVEKLSSSSPVMMFNCIWYADCKVGVPIAGIFSLGHYIQISHHSPDIYS